ncbi:MAG: RagB/SusD family nutrient uptake outer membrane protein [Dysgonamonadaceae bacterium]|jgi:hypothetical protein|nr:RagB/SusD family nutrient uptake outer membrane protein [Dysgonamonadaceae bacterium]
MKKIIYIIAVIIAYGLTSCDEIKFGDEFLGDAPESSGATLEEMFSSFINSEKILNRAYSNLPYGLPLNDSKMNGHVLETCTDLNYTFGTDIFVSLYYNGALNASSNSHGQIYQYGSESDWSAIRYSWIYIENIDKTPDIPESIKAERIAEAKMIIAISYSEMLRNIGGFPWIDHAVEPNETMQYPRLTFAESVDKIIALIDEAAPHLLWKQSDTDDGRMTKAGALGLKLRVLLFAASPTFNASVPWHGEADEYTRYANVDPARWTRAKNAGEEFMRSLSENGIYTLIKPEEETHQARREAYRKAYYDRGGTEILISVRKGFSSEIHEFYYGQRYYTSPTLNYVNMFSWEDGTDFPQNFNWENPATEPFFTEDDHKPMRDPRLYENVCVPGDIHFNGTIPPYYREHPNFRVGSNGGFFMMKFIFQDYPLRDGRPVQWPFMRLPEVLLSYAEAINETDGVPDAKAYECVNTIRSRVGLTALPQGLNKEQFREAVLKERALELGFEEVRWYDLVRWNRADDFKKTLYYLDVRIKSGTVSNPTSYSFAPMPLLPRYWARNWDTKWYLSPVPQNEINKKYGMTQNPGW